MIKLGEDIQSNIVGSDIEGNFIKSYSNKQFDDHIYISNLKISGSDKEINDFLNSKYGLLLEIESRLPDLDQVNRNLSVSRYKKTPLTLILLKLFLLP